MKCKVCKNKFNAKFFNQKTCFNPSCILEFNKQVKTKQLKEKKKVIKESLKTNSEHRKELQVLVNRFVRLRDKDKPCISCLKQLKSKFDAGHYRSSGGNPELRFNELNIHAQCVYCNQHLHGNLIDYRINLIARIGLDKVEWLEGSHEPLKLSIEEIKKLKEKYKEKIRLLK